MKLTAKKYIEDMNKMNPKRTKVVFRYPHVGDNVVLPIDEFIAQYGHREVDINGDFIDENGYIMNAFIHMLSK